MKLKSGDMLIMDVGNGVLKLQIIGRDDVPRVEKEGRGRRDGATVILSGADTAKFLDMISGTHGKYEVGDSGLSVEFEYDETLDFDLVILSIGKVSVRLTWPERTLLLYAIRNLAWMLFR